MEKLDPPHRIFELVAQPNPRRPTTQNSKQPMPSQCPSFEFLKHPTSKLQIFKHLFCALAGCFCVVIGCFGSVQAALVLPHAGISPPSSHTLILDWYFRKRFLAETRSFWLCAHTPSSGPHREITRVRSSGHSHNIPISRVNRSQISNIQTCHLVKYPISLISLTVVNVQLPLDNFDWISPLHSRKLPIVVVVFVLCECHWNFAATVIGIPSGIWITVAAY